MFPWAGYMLDQSDPFLDAEQRALLGVNTDADHQMIIQESRALDDI
jgi:hypothetical protein